MSKARKRRAIADKLTTTIDQLRKEIADRRAHLAQAKARALAKSNKGKLAAGWFAAWSRYAPAIATAEGSLARALKRLPIVTEKAEDAETQEREAGRQRAAIRARNVGLMRRLDALREAAPAVTKRWEAERADEEKRLKKLKKKIEARTRKDINRRPDWMRKPVALPPPIEQPCDTHYCRVRRGELDALRPLAKSCLYCGADLARWQTKFCSSLCSCRHARETPIERTCRICGAVFPSWERATVCSKKCGKALRIEKANRRRAKIVNASVEEFSSLEIFRRDGWRCQICGGKTDRRASKRSPLSPSLDHIIPISKGGTHSRTNTQCAHLICNLQKGAKEIGQLRMFG